MKREYNAVALYSGGVDSTVAPIIARERLGEDILLLMIDLGVSEEKKKRAEKRAEILNMDFHLIDGKKEFAEQFLSEAIRMNGSYWGYPLITPLSRAYMMKKAFEFLSKELQETRYVIHGCTIYQNTRFRIEKHCSLEPGVIPIGPLVSKQLTRKEKIEILEKHGIECGLGSDIAEDENMWGRALEGEPLNDLEDIEKKNVFTITKPLEETPDTPEHVSLTFKDGIPIAINGNEDSLDKIIISCGEMGARHGVGRILIFEDTIPELGYKQRGVFESPASEIIYTAHKYLEDAVFSKTEREIKRQLDHEWSEIVYRGGWYDSNRREISEFVKSMEHKVEGTIDLKIFKGHVLIGKADIPRCKLFKGPY